jgi:hypothetical protein
MEILCGQLNYNSDEVYFKCCYDGGGVAESNLGRYLVAGCWLVNGADAVIISW